MKIGDCCPMSIDLVWRFNNWPSIHWGCEIYCLIFIWNTWKVHYLNEIQTLYDQIKLKPKNASDRFTNDTKREWGKKGSEFCESEFFFMWFDRLLCICVLWQSNRFWMHQSIFSHKICIYSKLRLFWSLFVIQIQNYLEIRLLLFKSILLDG